MFLVYNIILTLLAPFWTPWMWWRARKRGEQPDWKERAGDYALEPRKDRKRVWVHAVSVGEVVASTPILKELRALLPDHEIVLSVTTSSGHRTAREHAMDLYDHLVYFPIDIVRFQLAAMQHVQPAAVAIMETELWMNFLWAAKVFDVRTLLVNGRISDRSFRRSQSLKAYYRTLLKGMDRCLMQTEEDASRIRALGARSVDVLGNAKMDQAVAGLEADPLHWKEELNLPEGKPVIVVGSTRGEEEEALVLKALDSVGFDQVAVVHAPRHLERVPALVEKLKLYGVQPSLRSKGEGGGYVVLDTYGELDQVYSVADLVIIGGGFSDLGGQNLLQPLAHGKPVLHGPHMQNFREAAELADREGAALRASTPEELAGQIRTLLADSGKRAAMSATAASIVRRSTGASRRYAEAIAEEVRRFHAENP